MAPYWAELVGNPSSPHAAGATAQHAVERGRTFVAQLIGATSSEITFTSGATEANNIAIQGIAKAALRHGVRRRQIIVAPIEHKSVLAAAQSLKESGFATAVTPVNRDGSIEVEGLRAMLSDDTLLVSVGLANGEIGTVQPIGDIAREVRKAGALLHSDLAQAVGRVPIDVQSMDIDLASLSAHKVHGPAGIGALFVSAVAALRPEPLFFGGAQEAGMRPGTTPVPLAVGFGSAAELAIDHLEHDALHTAALVQAFLTALTALRVSYGLNGSRVSRIPGSLSLQLRGVDGRSIVERVSTKLSISTGSACQAGGLDTSHVLQSINIPRDEQVATVRICFGRYNSMSDAATAAQIIAEAVNSEKLATGDVVQ